MARHLRRPEKLAGNPSFYFSIYLIYYYKNYFIIIKLHFPNSNLTYHFILLVCSKSNVCHLLKYVLTVTIYYLHFENCPILLHFVCCHVFLHFIFCSFNLKLSLSQEAKAVNRYT